MNQIIIIGNLVRDPETRSTPSGTQVCQFTVAVNRAYTSKDGEKRADFFRVSAWGARAETCQKYLAKGRKVAVEGSISVSAYSDRDGNAHGVLEINANNVEFLTPREQGAAQSAQPAPEAWQDFGDIDEPLPF